MAKAPETGDNERLLSGKPESVELTRPASLLDRILSWALAALAGFAGLGLALAVLLERLAPGYDPSLWAWDLRFLPSLPRLVLRVLGSLAFSWVALGWMTPGRRRSPYARRLALATVGAFALVALRDSMNTLELQRSSQLQGDPRWPFSIWPFSIWVALGCGAILARGWSRPKALARQRAPLKAARVLGFLIGVALWAALFARGQMACFGETDYRGDPLTQPADGIVIFGARAYANGAPSPALRYRVERALELYRQGFAPRLFLSGGPGDGAFHEVDVMASMLIQQGVPDTALIRDEGGWSTQLTVDHAAEHFGAQAELLAVSQAFHLPRIELTFARAGLDVRTVPAQSSRYPWVRQRNANRETLALGWYALRPLLGR